MPGNTFLQALLLTIQLGLFAAMVVGFGNAVYQAMKNRRLAFLPDRLVQNVPWSGKDVVLVVLLWLVINIGVGVGFMAFTRAKPSKADEVAKEVSKVSVTPLEAAADADPSSFKRLMLLGTILNALLILAIPPLLRLTCRARLSDLGFTTVDLARNIRLGFRSFLVATPLVYLVFLLAGLVWRPNKHPLELMMLKEMTPGVAILGLLSAVVFAPIAEELLFRSILQGWLIRWFLGTAKLATNRPEEPAVESVEVAIEPPLDLENPFEAPRSPIDVPPNDPNPEFATPRKARRAEFWGIAITSFLFAAAHAAQMPAPLALFVLSVVLGLLTSRIGSLVPAIVLHAAFNGFSTLGLLVKALGPEG